MGPEARNKPERGQTAGVQEIDDEKFRQKVMRNSVIFSGVFTVYPLFLGFWLSRKKIANDVQEWF